MFLACSAENKILEIPEQGLAIVAGYFCPEKGKNEGLTLLQWEKGQVSGLHPIDEEQMANLDARSDLYHWEDYTLCPGFIDAHVHLALDSVDFFQCLDNWQNPALIETKIEKYLRQYLERGITAIRDGSDLPGFAWRAKQRVQAKQWLGPEIVAVREAVNRKGMYGRFLGRGFDSLEHWRLTEAEFYAQGADQLKVIVTGIISFKNYGQVGEVQWTAVELKELVESAHRCGLKVMAHASGAEGISIAIEAGVDSIEHGYFITLEHLERMSEKGIAWVPTVAPIGNLLKYPTKRYSEREMANLTRILQSQLKRIKEAYDLGVRLGIGTDAGAYLVPHGESLMDELQWMREAGLPWDDILKIATKENARICGLPGYGALGQGSSLSHLQLADFRKFKD